MKGMFSIVVTHSILMDIWALSQVDLTIIGVTTESSGAFHYLVDWECNMLIGECQAIKLTLIQLQGTTATLHLIGFGRIVMATVAQAIRAHSERL